MATTATRVEARTESGVVAGLERAGIAVFPSVPFAAAPYGERRFELAQPVEPWDGTRDVTATGVGYLQPWRRDDPWDGYVNPGRQGEDLLSLQITTPDLGAAGLPVMVWIHGGAFVSGVGSAPASRGDSFARDGVVHVSVNYRMSLDGYTLLEDSIETGTENLGLRDQLAALRWVQRNIAAFGGDPARVTVAGQSAGAVSVGYLLSSPLARGLFQRAIIQSGFPSLIRTVSEAEARFAAVAEAAGRPATRAALRDLTIDQSRDVVARLHDDFERDLYSGRAALSDSVFSGVSGTESLPVGIAEGLVEGAGSHIPILIGNTRDEASGIVERMGLIEASRSPIARAIATDLGAPADAAERYRAASRAGAGDGVILNAVFTDVTARMPAIDILSRRSGLGYLYEFAWQSPGRPAGLGADHVVDVPFMQHDFESFRDAAPIGNTILGDHPPVALAEAMHGAFVDFVRTGEPGWAPYTNVDRMTMRFDTDSAVLSDPAQAEREIWEGQ